MKLQFLPIPIRKKLILLLSHLLLCMSATAETGFDTSLISQWGYQLSKSSTFNAKLCGGSITPSQVQHWAIKSTTPLAESPDTYYRFTLGIETFSSNKEMDQRIKELTNPGKRNSLQSKSCDLISFFDCKNKVYFVHTDALLFAAEMERIKNQFFRATCGAES